MADLAVLPDTTRLVEWDNGAGKFDAPSASPMATTNGGLCVVRYDSSGRVVPAQADAEANSLWCGISVTEIGRNGQAVTVIREGLLDVGNILGDLAIGAPVYLSDTLGRLSDTAGTVNTIVGRVVPAWGNLTSDKLLMVGKGTGY
jgi:hypothetical protein